MPQPVFASDTKLLETHALGMIASVKPGIIMGAAAGKQKTTGKAGKPPRIPAEQIRDSAVGGQVAVYAIAGDQRPQMHFRSVSLPGLCFLKLVEDVSLHLAHLLCRL